ncbi:MAG: enoyl-CoA hydratase/isomerase family protein [Actinobacteria bacterium]|nr:enoyl-CoA hydratase/isomerase family protein [Actinomycetota bacterium]
MSGVDGVELQTLELRLDGGVARVTFDHPPVNVFDAALQADLEAALEQIEARPEVRVVVFQSANPDFFIAHYDVGDILAEETGALRAAAGSFNRLMSRIRDGERVTIGKVRGAARGGGCEFLLALDLRFASLERARFGFPEVALGILAAGGGTQRLPATIGRARALEMLLGGDDLTAEVAERYGLVNRAVPEGELDELVNRLAGRIASYQPEVVAITKLAASSAADGPGQTGFALEALLLDVLKSAPAARRRMARFLDAGAQTVAGERRFQGLLEALGEEPEA